MILRLIVILLLGVAGIVGLGMSLCGGVITLAGLTESGHRGEFSAASMRVISVPSLIVGLLIVGVVAWLSIRRLRRRPDATGSQETDTGQ